MDEVLRAKIRSWLRRNLGRICRDRCVDINRVTIMVAKAAGHPEWVEDEDHWVYEEVLEEAKRRGLTISYVYGQGVDRTDYEPDDLRLGGHRKHEARSRREA